MLGGFILREGDKVNSNTEYVLLITDRWWVKLGFYYQKPVQERNPTPYALKHLINRGLHPKRTTHTHASIFFLSLIHFSSISFLLTPDASLLPKWQHNPPQTRLFRLVFACIDFR